MKKGKYFARGLKNNYFYTAMVMIFMLGCFLIVKECKVVNSKYYCIQNSKTEQQLKACEGL